MKLFLFFISIFLTYYLLKLSIPFLNKNFSDNPNSRSLHTYSKPRAGGLFFVIIGTIFSTLNNYFLPIFCLPLSFLGLLDDKYKISRSSRYLTQIITIVFILLNSSILTENLRLNILSIIFFALLTIFSTGLINFINFMDGSDGLVGGCISIILFFEFLSGNHNVIFILGSLIGFLILNWDPSKVFMGDVGSTFLGSFIVGIIFNQVSLDKVFAIIFISTPLFADAAICVCRRFLVKENIFTAHKSHLYQRLCQNNIAHKNVALIYILATTILSFSYYLFDLKCLIISSIIAIFIGYYIDKKFALPFKETLKKRA